MEIIKNLQLRIALYEDMSAYKKLYILLFDGLHRFSYNLVKSREGAEEIVSDVFLKLWQIRTQLLQIQNLKVYLYTIAKNLSLNHIARNTKHSVFYLHDIDVEAIREPKSPEDLFISKETTKRVEQAVRQLPPQCKIVFQLVREDGLKYKEVAGLLNISVFTVRNQMAIATKKISETLYPRFSACCTKTVSDYVL